ncbi:MAG TPA: AAA family ATPase [Bryobacteraceae bacterium]|nr:AAA family ATPase [Bryobacteraceae bacterium]
MFALDRLTIERFRGLQDLTLDNLGRVNLLVGPNNSGKTSVLEAISLFSRPLDLGAWLQAAYLREVPRGGDPFFGGMEWFFPHWRLTDGLFAGGDLAISASGRLPIREVSAVYKPISRLRATSPAGVPYDADLDGHQEAGAHMELKTIWEGGPPGGQRVVNDLWEDESPRLTSNTELLNQPVHLLPPHRAESIQVREYSKAAQAGLKQQTLVLLQTIDSQIRDVQILAPNGRLPAIYVEYGTFGLRPLSSLGDGTRRALSIAVLVASLAKGVLLIDEIESSLHTSAFGSLFSWLVKSCEELDVQIFATTHSLEAVDAMVEAESKNLDRIVGYHLEAPNGVPQVQRLDGHLLHRLRYERGLDVRL